MKITPVGQKILVLPLETKETTTDGGIIIPSSVATADLREAQIVEVSDELTNKYKPGQKVLYPSRAGLGQDYNGAFHLWLREDIGEIWALLDLPNKIAKDKGDNL